MSKVTSPIASYSTAPSDHATLKHHPAPPSDSEAPGDSVKKKKNLQPSLSTKDTPRDHTIPIMQLSSISASKIACDSTVISPNVLIPSSAPYYAAKQRRGRPLPRTPAPGCKNCQILFTELQVVKQLLECEIERNHELKQIHSSTKRANVSTVYLVWLYTSLWNILSFTFDKQICLMILFISG